MLPAAAFADHEKLDNLVILYDGNKVVLTRWQNTLSPRMYLLVMRHTDGTFIEDGGNFGAGFDKSYAGKNLYFGIREHAMGSILNGIAYHGIFKASGSTFAVFVDYFRPTIRVASLAELGRVSYILTHDSIGVGEDGPTHQPVETVSDLCVFPNLDVWCPRKWRFLHTLLRPSFTFGFRVSCPSSVLVLMY